MMNTGRRVVLSRNGLLTTIAWKLGADEPVEYALEGAVAVAGSGLVWLRDAMKLFSDVKGTKETLTFHGLKLVNFLDDL